MSGNIFYLKYLQGEQKLSFFFGITFIYTGQSCMLLIYNLSLSIYMYQIHKVQYIMIGFSAKVEIFS